MFGLTSRRQHKAALLHTAVMAVMISDEIHHRLQNDPQLLIREHGAKRSVAIWPSGKRHGFVRFTPEQLDILGAAVTAGMSSLIFPGRVTVTQSHDFLMRAEILPARP